MSHSIPIKHDDDRRRVALELIGSVQVSTDDAENTRRLRIAVAAAKAGLASDDHNPLCEVLK